MPRRAISVAVLLVLVLGVLALEGASAASYNATMLPSYPNATADDYAGTSVAVSGSVVAVGAPQFDWNGINAQAPESVAGNGIVVLYSCPPPANGTNTLGTCTYASTLSDPLATEAGFGAIVELAANGTFLVVSAVNYNSGDGAIYVYHCPTPFSCVLLNGQMPYTFPGLNYTLGFSLSVASGSANGSQFVVAGALGYGSFGGFFELHCALPSSCDNDGDLVAAPYGYAMGYAVGINPSANLVALGGLGYYMDAPLFLYSCAEPTTVGGPVTCAGIEGAVDTGAYTGFGSAIAMTDSFLAVGSFLLDLEGFVYVFSCNTTFCNLDTYIVLADASGYAGDLDFFGYYMYAYGSALAVGAPDSANNGFIDLFECSGSPMTCTARNKIVAPATVIPANQTTAFFGLSIAMDDNTILVAAPGDSAEHDYQGSVYAFQCTTPGLFCSNPPNVPSAVPTTTLPPTCPTGCSSCAVANGGLVCLECSSGYVFDMTSSACTIDTSSNPGGSSSSAGWAFLIYAVYLACVIVLYFFIRARNPAAVNGLFIVAALGLFDLLVDIIFAAVLNAQDAAAVCAAVFLVVPLVLDVVGVPVILLIEGASTDLALWQHPVWAAASLVLFSKSAEHVFLSTSNILDIGAFNAKISTAAAKRLTMLAVLVNVLEFLSQMGTQVAVGQKHGWNTLNTLAILSCFGFFFAFALRRLLAYVRGVRANKQDEPQHLQKDGDNANRPDNSGDAVFVDYTEHEKDDAKESHQPAPREFRV